MSLDPALQAVLKRQAAIECLVSFYHHLDANAYEACLRCFTEDGSWMRLGTLHQGQDALRGVLYARPGALLVRHLLSNLHADLQDQDHAMISAYVSVYAHRFESEALSLPAPMKSPVGIYSLSAEILGFEGAWRIRQLSMAAQFYGPPDKVG